MLRCLQRSILAGLALLLAGCSPATMIEKLPESVGGMPAGAPAAPATPYHYPAVHDMPPPRADQPLNEEQQYQLEQDLQTARDHLQDAQKADQAAEEAEQKADQAGEEANTAQKPAAKKKPAGKNAAAKAKKKAKAVKKPDQKPDNTGSGNNP